MFEIYINVCYNIITNVDFEKEDFKNVNRH